MSLTTTRLIGDPLWYKDAVLYEIHVRAFYDSNGDGIGDFRGLAEKLDYLQDLGVTALWLLPFYPSPLRDDGYDIADYRDVHPNYGTLRDFKLFLRMAHRRGLRVITELVLNHTSDQHPWFQQARRADKEAQERAFYVWSETSQKYKDARIIFQDFESSNWSWDPTAQAYYWHRFYSHQPDLNWENPEVRKAMFDVLDFWLEMGIDGLRLDAVPYLYEREGTNCENLPETHEMLRELRRHVDATYRHRMLLAEANQWPEDAAAYFGTGNECHMAFHFPIMPRMFMAIHREDRYPILDILQQTPPIPENAQWALFLRNHDELTLEMVTDEERDYMYRVYAHDPQARINLGIRRRLAPLLGNNRRKIELMNGLLLSLPGTPVIYYGDEIGMGDNIYMGDRNGVRTPMQWSADRNAGFSRCNPQRLYLPVTIDPEYHYETINVEAQHGNPHSLFWWMKRVIALRQRFKAFGRGTMRFLFPENRKVLAFLREYGSEKILVVANLSRFAQYVELDLVACRGMVPVELFGKTEFPPIGELPYLLTLGPHSFYWFLLESKTTEAPVMTAPSEAPRPQLRISESWEELIVKQGKRALEEILPAYLRPRRWFGGKARKISGTILLDAVPIPTPSSLAHLCLLRVDYADAPPEVYTLPLAHAGGERAAQILDWYPHAVIAELRTRPPAEESAGVLYDAFVDPRFCDALLDAISRRKRFHGIAGEMTAAPTGAFRAARGPQERALEPSILRGEQSNTSVVYGDRLLLKLYRRIDEGPHPEVELGLFLHEHTSFRHLPQVAGLLEYRAGAREPMALGILHQCVPNQGDAWKYTLDEVRRSFESALTRPSRAQPPPDVSGDLLTLSDAPTSDAAREFLGGYLESARTIGKRTGEMHAALAAETEDADFAPEPYSTLYQRSLYQSIRIRTQEALQLLRKKLPLLSPPNREEADKILAREGEAFSLLRSLLHKKIAARRIRCHGDFHLGQLLFTGRDFIVIDFEGEPARSLGERRLKRSPFRDGAGMIRSFHYAAFHALQNLQAPEGESSLLARWATVWFRWTAAAFLRSYLAATAEASLFPPDRRDLKVLLDVHLLEKAVYELEYELNNRPDWVGIPIRGMTEILDTVQRS